MKNLKPLIQESWPDEAMLFGLAIQVSDPDNNQLHAATLYRFNGRLMIGDLQNHFVTRRDDARASKNLYWLAPDLSQEDQRILAAKADAWLDENSGRIPYSVAHPGGVVFSENIWVGNEPGQGLTCATFVVELFNELGIPFIDSGTWLTRAGDAEWAQRILDAISHLMSPEHVEAQKNRIGNTIRIRPADVAAAGLLINQQMETSLEFQDIAALSADIEKGLLDLSEGCIPC